MDEIDKELEERLEVELDEVRGDERLCWGCGEVDTIRRMLALPGGRYLCRVCDREESQG